MYGEHVWERSVGCNACQSFCCSGKNLPSACLAGLRKSLHPQKAFCNTVALHSASRLNMGGKNALGESWLGGSAVSFLGDSAITAVSEREKSLQSYRLAWKASDACNCAFMKVIFQLAGISTHTAWKLFCNLLIAHNKTFSH